MAVGNWMVWWWSSWGQMIIYENISSRHYSYFQSSSRKELFIWLNTYLFFSPGWLSSAWLTFLCLMTFHSRTWREDYTSDALASLECLKATPISLPFSVETWSHCSGSGPVFCSIHFPMGQVLMELHINVLVFSEPKMDVIYSTKLYNDYSILLDMKDCICTDWKI